MVGGCHKFRPLHATQRLNLHPFEHAVRGVQELTVYWPLSPLRPESRKETGQEAGGRQEAGQILSSSQHHRVEHPAVEPALGTAIDRPSGPNPSQNGSPLPPRKAYTISDNSEQPKASTTSESSNAVNTRSPDNTDPTPAHMNNPGFLTAFMTQVI